MHVVYSMNEISIAAVMLLVTGQDKEGLCWIGCTDFLVGEK